MVKLEGRKIIKEEYFYEKSCWNCINGLGYD